MSVRQNLAERVASFIAGEPRNKRDEQIEQLTDLFIEAYRRGPMLLPPEEMLTRLGELDSQYLELIIRTMIQSVPVTTQYGEETESLRTRVITDSQTMYVNDVLSGHIIDLWTDFGFGLQVDVVPREPKLKTVWEEFWQAPRNAPVLNVRDIHSLSMDVLTDGELFFVFFVSTLDGTSTVRTIPSAEVTGRVCDPDDDRVVLYWERTWTPKGDSLPQKRYYPNWTASPEDLKRAKLPEDAVLGHEGRENTTSVVLPVQHRKRKGRGWPLLTAGFPWSRAYRDFLQDRAAVAKAVATYVDKLKVKGGQRAIDQLVRKLSSSLQTSDNPYETNPSDPAGSTWMENEAVERTRLSLATGSADAEKDGGAMLAQAVLAGRIFPHYAGRGEAFRLATATAMEEPVRRAFNRYQNFWGSVWADMVKIVAMMKEQYGGMTFKDHEADVNSDPILQKDPQLLTAVLDGLIKTSESGLIEPQTSKPAADHLIRIILQAIGIKDLDSVIGTPRTWEDIPEEPEEPELSDEALTADMFPPEGEEELPPDDGEEIPVPESVPPTGRNGSRRNRFPKASPRLRDLELVESYSSFAGAIRNYVYGLWTGELTRLQFVDGMVNTITRNLNLAWMEGLRSAGIAADEMTDRERDALSNLIHGQFEYLVPFADAIIQNSRKNGGALAPLQDRGRLWLNRYNDARNRALTMAESDPKLRWVSPKKYCKSCKRLHGKIKRASYWEEHGVKPQSPPNENLECEGWRCECYFAVTSDPVSRGPLPWLP